MIVEKKFGFIGKGKNEAGGTIGQGLLIESGDGVTKSGFLGNRFFGHAQNDNLAGHFEVNQEDVAVRKMNRKLFAVTRKTGDFLANKFFGVTEKRFTRENF